MLYAFGDSYTFGQGMPDVDNKDPDKYVLGDSSQHVWPVHLAEFLDTSLENHAYCGASMLHITKIFLDNYYKMSQDDVVVIAWTYMERWSVINDDTELLPIFNLLPNMPNVPGVPNLEGYLPFNTTAHKINMFCMMSTLITSLCDLKGIQCHHRILDCLDFKDFKKHRPDWYTLKLPNTSLLYSQQKSNLIKLYLNLIPGKLPDYHCDQDTHRFWAQSIHREISRS
jgi:hypothetical protein